MSLGLLSDRVKVWKLVLGMHIANVLALVLFVTNVTEADHIYTKESPAPIAQDIGLTLCIALATAIYTLNLSLLSKSISSCV